MSGAKIVEGARDAVAWTKATKGGTELPTEVDRAFLSRLSTKGITTSRQVGLLADRAQDRVRQRCRRLGWVMFAGPHTVPSSKVSGWVLTEAGRIVLETRVHQADAPQPGQNREIGQ